MLHEHTIANGLVRWTSYSFLVRQFVSNPWRVSLSKVVYHTCFICGQRCKCWSRQLKLTLSVISGVKPIIYIFVLHLNLWSRPQCFHKPLAEHSGQVSPSGKPNFMEGGGRLPLPRNLPLLIWREKTKDLCELLEVGFPLRYWALHMLIAQPRNHPYLSYPQKSGLSTVRSTTQSQPGSS